jgi:hypothetical protein
MQSNVWLPIYIGFGFVVSGTVISLIVPNPIAETLYFNSNGIDAEFHNGTFNRAAE